MYIGAALSLGGAALFYKSVPVLAYGTTFLLACHLFVGSYEKPTLQRTWRRRTAGASGDGGQASEEGNKWLPKKGAGLKPAPLFINMNGAAVMRVMKAFPYYIIRHRRVGLGYVKRAEDPVVRS